MKENRRNIRSMFSGFEPEIENAAVDAGWEKIRYFLPAEKKRRGFLFFKRTGLLLVFAGVIFSGFFLVRSIDQESSKKEMNVQQKSKDNNPDEKNLLSAGKPRQKASVKKEQPPHSGVHKDKASADPGLNEQADPGVTIPGEHVPDKPLKEKESTLSFVAGNNATMQKDTFQHYTTMVEPLQLHNDSIPSREEPVVYQELDPKSLFLPVNADTLDVALTPISRNDPAKGIKANKFSIELLGGPGLTSTWFKPGGSDLSITDKQTNLSLGVGLAYMRKETWGILGGFKVNGNKVDQSYVGVTGNKIIKKIIISNVTSMAPDTQVTYVQVRSSNVLRAKLSYNVNLGLVYNLYRKQRWTIGTFVLLDLRRSVYTFSSGNYEYGDTLTYVQNPVNAPLSNNTPETGESLKTRYTVTNIGIMPGLLLSYDLTRRLTCLVRPAYFKQLTANRVSPAQNYFDLRQNTISLDLGLRIKL